ncbi:MAG TPA: ATP-grasp domain-containing protein [Candidatus Saccharimonadales bacterium]
MTTRQPQYLLVIDRLVGSILAAVEELRNQSAYANLEVLLLTHVPEQHKKFSNDITPDHIIACDFSSRDEIATLIEPFWEHIRGVICRGDKQIQFLRATIPLLPPDMLVATCSSLAAATNKRLMREAFLQHFPEITPQFAEARDDSPSSVARVEAHLRYPVIVKPTDLAASLLIQSCRGRAELQRALQKTFTNLQAVYEREERQTEPQVIIEEYLEGDFYSIDAYVMAADEVYYCPPVGYVPAKQIGIDDFAIYKRFIPTKLTRAQIAEAQDATRKATAALGLTHTTVHVELALTAQGWKIIELGPRAGRFRHKMYSLGYGIDHSLNDVRIHLGLKPTILKTLKRYCAAYEVCPDREGVLREIAGIVSLQASPSVSYIRVVAKPGQQCLFAKHGGHMLAEFVVSSDDRQEFAAACQAAESVRAIID